MVSAPYTRITGFDHNRLSLHVRRPFLHGKARETPLVLHIGARTWDYTARLGALPARAADRCILEYMLVCQ